MPRKFSSAALSRAAIVLLLGTAATAGAEPSRGNESAPGFRLQLPDHLELAPAQPATLQLRLQPAPGHRVSKKAPLRIDLEPPEGSGVTVKKARLGHGDAMDPESVSPAFRALVRAAEPGRYELKVSLEFWLCRDKLCRPVRSDASLQLEVRAPVEPAEPDAGPASDSAARTAPN